MDLYKAAAEHTITVVRRLLDDHNVTDVKAQRLVVDLLSISISSCHHLTDHGCAPRWDVMKQDLQPDVVEAVHTIMNAAQMVVGE